MLSQAAARADVAQLVRLLTESHPDPYSAGGGPIAFHRRADEVLAAIPAGGLSRARLLRLIRPLVASAGDGHTALTVPPGAAEAPVYARLSWDVVEQDLYISAVAWVEDRPLLGARLAGLCGVPAAGLAERLRRLRGCDNEYQLLAQLALALAHPAALADLLDLDALPADAPLDLFLPDGGQVTVALQWDGEAPGAIFSPPSVLTPPALNAARLGWSFLD